MENREWVPSVLDSRASFIRRVSLLCSKLNWDFGEPDSTGWTFEDGARSALYRDRYYGGRA